MKKLIIPIGISGSGKSLYGCFLKQSQKDLFIICPDDIRKEVTGNISDQSQNDKVFGIVEKRIQEAARDKVHMFLSATNLSINTHQIKRYCSLIGPDYRIELHLLNDSYDMNLCLSRIKKDLESNIERSIVTEEVIQRQYDKFMKLILNIQEITKNNNCVFKVIPGDYRKGEIK